MKFRLKKRGSGEAIVTFIRDDDTSTSGQLGQAGFGAVHDLTHYVVETTLRTRDGFFGLLAAGWDIADFERKGAAREIPSTAIAVECLVGQLSNIVFNGRQLPAEEFNWLAAEALRGVRPEATAPTVGDGTLNQMIAQLAALARRWRELPLGGIMELPVELD